MAEASVDPPLPSGGIDGPVRRWVGDLVDLSGRAAVARAGAWSGRARAPALDLSSLEDGRADLRPGRTQAIWTPRSSHLRARPARSTFDSDVATDMPPRGVDGIRFDARDGERIDFGPAFVLGAQQRLTRSRLAGSRLVERRRSWPGGATSSASSALRTRRAWRSSPDTRTWTWPGHAGGATPLRLFERPRDLGPTAPGSGP